MSDVPDQQVSAGDSRLAKLRRLADGRNIPLGTILVSVLTLAAVYLVGKLVYRLREVLLLALVGAFVAVVLNPLVVALQRWKIRRRGAAVAVVVLWSLLVFAGLAIAFGYPLVNALTHHPNALPSYVSKAEHGQGWIGHVLRKYHVQSWVDKNSAKLVSLAQGLSKPALTFGEGAVSVVLTLVATYAFVTLLLLEAPKMKRVVLEMMSPERAARVSSIGAEVSRSAAGFVLGNVVTSLIAGLVVFVTLTVLSVPFALLWGLWVALVDFLPSIGGALAGIPTVLFALGHSLTAGIITAVVFVVYTQVENHVLNPVVMSRTVRLNPLTVFVAVIVGAEIGAWVGGLFGGFVGVLLAIPAAATVHVLIRELWRSTGPTPAPPPLSVDPAAPRPDD